MVHNDIPAVFQSAPWFLPGSTDHTAIAEQALTWLLDNPQKARKLASSFVVPLFKRPERMTQWLTAQHGHILEYRRRRAAFLALKPDDLLFCACDMRERPLSSCVCNYKKHPSFSSLRETDTEKD